MHRTTRWILLCVGVLLGAVAPLQADLVTITDYDILQAPLTGTGSWAHLYSGTITPTGSFTIDGFPADRGDYTGGSGTLNDGLPGTGTGDTQLLGNTVDFVPVITLNLDAFYSINTITLFSFDGGNSIPGVISSFDVTINGTTVTFATSEPTPNDEFVDLAGSALDGLVTDQIMLSNFVHDGSNGLPGFFAIGEVEIDGTPSGGGVPEPSALSLLGATMALATVRRRRRVA